MSITLHTGLPRTGKTYGMHKTIMQCLNRGMIVYSNYKINWNGCVYRKFNWKKLKFSYHTAPKTNLRYWNKLPDLFEAEKGIIAMDEAHVYLNSRRWMELPEQFERKLMQHGKDGLHIIGTVQNLRRLDTVMRELIDYWYVYNVWPKAPHHPWKKHKPKIFIRWQIKIETDMSKRELYSNPRIYFFKQKFANTYNTLEKIYIDDSLKLN